MIEASQPRTNMSKPEERFTLQISAELREFLNKYAADHDLNVSQVVRIAVREFVQSRTETEKKGVV